MTRVKRLRYWGWGFAVLHIPIAALLFAALNPAENTEPTPVGTWPAVCTISDEYMKWCIQSKSFKDYD